MAVEEVVTLEELAPWLSRYVGKLDKIDWRPALEAIALVLEHHTKERFETGTAPDGTPWLPLKMPRSRLRDRKTKGGSGNHQRPLRDTGLLMASFSANHASHVREITNDGLSWGSNLDYAGIHQHGGEINIPERYREKPWVFHTMDGKTVFTRRIRATKITIPPRPFVGLNDEMIAEINEILVDTVVSQLEAA